MAARRPGKVTPLSLVCAAHALLAWALLSMGSSRSAPASPLRDVAEPHLLTVVLHSEPAAVRSLPPELRRWDAAPPALVPAPVPALVPALVLELVPAPVPARVEATAPTAEPRAPTLLAPAPLPAVEPAAAVAPAKPIEAPAHGRTAAPARPEPEALVQAHADRQRCPPAPHPAALRERGIEGAVLLRVRVDMQGRPADVTVLAGSGWRLFDEAALRQVRACRFIPATQGGQAVDSWVEFPVRFALAG